MPKDDKDSGDLVYLSPPIRQHHILLKPTDSELKVGIVRPIKDGENLINTDLVSLEPCENGPGYRMKYVYKSSKGPAKVATDAYRAGWDRIFGSN